MSIPVEHKAHLERQLQVHKDRIETLRYEMENIQTEIRIHELVLAFGSNEALVPTLEALSENPIEAHQAQADPRGYAESRGMELPEGFSISFDSHDQGLTVRAKYEDDRWPFELAWNQETGFSSRRPSTADTEPS